MESYWVFMGFHGFSWVFMGFHGFYLVAPGETAVGNQTEDQVSVLVSSMFFCLAARCFRLSSQGR